MLTHFHNNNSGQSDLYASFLLRQVTQKENLKKKKDQPTDPPNFQAKRANKQFISLGIIL